MLNVTDFRRFDQVRYSGTRSDFRKMLDGKRGEVDSHLPTGKVVCAFPKGKSDDGENQGSFNLILDPSDLMKV